MEGERGSKRNAGRRGFKRAGDSVTRGAERNRLGLLWERKGLQGEKGEACKELKGGCGGVCKEGAGEVRGAQGPGPLDPQWTGPVQAHGARSSQAPAFHSAPKPPDIRGPSPGRGGTRTHFLTRPQHPP